VIERYRGLDIPKFFRGDAAFAGPKLLRLLEQEGFRYAIRIKANAVLERKIAHLLRRPAGRPSHKPKVFYHSFRYRAGSWACAAGRPTAGAYREGLARGLPSMRSISLRRHGVP
jgi:hypothetical protein